MERVHSGCVGPDATCDVPGSSSAARVVAALLLLAAAGCHDAPAPSAPPAQVPTEDGATWTLETGARLAAERRQIQSREGTLLAPMPRATVEARFTRGGFGFYDEEREALHVRLVGWGRDVATPLGDGPARLVASAEEGLTGPASRLEIDRDALVEWFDGRDDGLAHSWTVTRRPEGPGPLTFDLAFEGAAAVAASPDGARITDHSGETWTVSRLAAWDADGDALPVNVLVRDLGMSLVVDDTGATWPVTVDPVYTAPFQRLLAGDTSYDVTVATDVDRDGFDDLIVGVPGFGNATGQIRVFHGAPGGLESQPRTLITGPTASAFASWIVALDANHDGYGDVAAVTSASVRVHLGTPSGLSTSASTVLTGQMAAAGDVTGDGYDDVVVRDASTLHTYPGGPGGIDETSVSSLNIGSSNLSITVADVEDNGFGDVVVALNQSSGCILRVYPGTPSGMSLTASTTLTVRQTTGGSAGSATIYNLGDVDGDGTEDIGVREGPALAYGYIYWGAEFGLDPDRTQLSIDRIYGRVGDLDGDGLEDFAVENEQFQYPDYEQFTAVLGGRPVVERTDWLGAVDRLTAGDFDGDGSRDAAATLDGEVEIHPGFVETPTLTLVAPGEPDFGLATALAAGRDVDGDGHADLVVPLGSGDRTIYFFKGGTSGFPRYASATRGAVAPDDAFGQALAFADVNDDGYADLVVGAPRYQSLAGQVLVFQGSAGGLDLASPATQTGVAGDLFGWALRSAGDVDNDGFEDVVVGGPGYDTDAGRVWLLRGSPTGLLARQAVATGGALERLGSSVAGAGDVNGDGFDDVIVGAPSWSSGRGQARVHLGSAAGLASDPHLTVSGTATTHSTGYAVAGVGDVDNDGFDDVTVSTNGGFVRLYRGDASQMSGTAATALNGSQSSFGTSVAGIHDVNDDGRADVLIGQPGDRKALLHAGSASGLATSPSTYTEANTGFGTVVADAGDVDADGWGDVIVASTEIVHVYRGYDSDATAEIVVTSAATLTTSDLGGDDVFSLRLSRGPTAPVVIPLSVSLPDDIGLTHQEVVLDTSNWWLPQTVGVFGLPDDDVDEEVAFTVIIGPAQSSDPAFQGIDPTDLPGLNGNDDAAALVLSNSTVLTHELATQDAFTVRLMTRPHAPVTLPIASSDVGEATVSPAELVFTEENWQVPAQVTVTGVPDGFWDQDQPYTISVGPPEGDDTDYAVLPAAVVTGTNQDEEGTVVASKSSVTVKEGTFEDTFTIVLSKAPTASVIVPISSSDATAATVSPSSITFTTTDWSTPRTVSVGYVDDLYDDGDQSFSVVLGAVQTTAPRYTGLDPADIPGVTQDNDTAGFVTATTLETWEWGWDAQLPVRLRSKPTADVQVSVTSVDPDEVTVSTGTLLFTPANWNVDQVLVVGGVDDNAADGDQNYAVKLEVAASDDPVYDALAPLLVPGVSHDGGGPAVVVTTAPPPTREGGSSTTAWIALRTQPTNNVVVPISSGDTTEGTVSLSSVTFTTTNWATPRGITVTPAQDTVRDGPVTWSIVLGVINSNDDHYDDLNPPDIEVVTQDDEPYFEVTVSDSTAGEDGSTGRFRVRPIANPQSEITIDFASMNLAEGSTAITSLTFNASNYGTYQDVYVYAVDDEFDDGDKTFLVRFTAVHSSHALWQYANLPPDVTMTNADDEVSGLVVSPLSGLSTNESGTTDTFEVALACRPMAQVTVSVTPGMPDEATAEPSQLVFVADEWDVPQTVTVTGVPDALDDGAQGFNIVLNPISSDLKYDSASNIAVVGQNFEESAEVYVSGGPITTDEGGGTDTFTVALARAPSATVTVALGSSDTTEATFLPSWLTFTSTNWSAQTVTVTGVDDAATDGNQPYTITVGPITTTSPAYTGVDPDDVAGTNLDDEAANLFVSAASLRTAELGGDETFTVRLSTQPSANVVVAVASLDTTEVTVGASSLTFTAANWDTPKSVVVHGVDDGIPDGTQSYTVQVGPITSTDSAYAALPVVSIPGTNADGWAPGVLVEGGPLQVSETGTTDTFTVVLRAQPDADVTIPVSVSDAGEGEADPIELVFTAADWEVPQEVVVTGVGDAVLDGAVAWHVLLGAVESGDDWYVGLDPDDVDVVTLDDEPFFSVQSDVLTTTEGGGSDTFTVTLLAPPAAAVQLDVASSAPAEVAVSPATLSFLPGNWSSPRTVVVTGVNDAVVDGNQAAIITFTDVRSTDPVWDDATLPGDLLVLNVDDDVAGVVLAPLEITTDEDGGVDEIEVSLSSKPTSTVTISVTSSDTAEGVVSDPTLSFTPTNWGLAQAVEIVGVDDADLDGDTPYDVEIVTASDDPLYDQLFRVVEAVNQDNEDGDTDPGSDTDDPDDTDGEGCGCASIGGVSGGWMGLLVLALTQRWRRHSRISPVGLARARPSHCADTGRPGFDGPALPALRATMMPARG